MVLRHNEPPRGSRELQAEADERNRGSEAFIKQHYGNSIGPRRRFRWEVRGNEIICREQ